MKTSKIATAGIALLATALVALTGCSYPGDDEDRAAFHAGAKDPNAPAASAPSADPEAPVEDGENTEDVSQDEPTGATANLGVENGQVQYFRAVQNFSPTLERWVVDEDADEVTYSLINCVGQTKSEGVATLEPADGEDESAWTATWIGKSPIENVAAESIRLEITEDTLANFSDVATSRTEIEAGDFSRVCADAGETAADFVL